MKTALAIAELSHDPDTKVGVVLVKDNYIISTGYNGTPKDTSNEMKCANGNTLPTVIHAEVNALLIASRSTVSTEGATCYTTFSPCLNCMVMLKQAGIKKVYYLDTKNTTSQDEAMLWAHNNGIGIKHASIDRLSSKEDDKK